MTKQTTLTLVDWDEVRALRDDILPELEAELALMYRRRLAIMLAMVKAGCSRREIGAYWGVSNPRVTQMVNRTHQRGTRS